MDTGEIPTRVGEFGAWCRCRIFGRSAHMCNAKQFGCAWFCLAHRRIPENGSWDSRRDSLQATAVVRYGGYAAALSLAALAQQTPSTYSPYSPKSGLLVVSCQRCYVDITDHSLSGID